MRRTVWIAVGATAGVIAYRRGQKLLEEARARGVVGSMQAATVSASSVAASARNLLATIGAQAPEATPVPSTPITGSAAARVLAESRVTR